MKPSDRQNRIINELIERCRSRGLRRTQALERLLETIFINEKPMTLNELTHSEHLHQTCDKATVFRLLQRLAAIGVVRRLGLHERAAYFCLLLPERHHDYLICTECGSIESIKAACPVHALEIEIREKTGFRDLYHELEFFGICPRCHS